MPETPKRRRPVVVPEFGRVLTGLRGKRSRGVVVRLLRDSYGLPLDDTTLLQYERGTVSAPDPAVMWALARIYGATLEELISVLVMERTDRPVPAAGRIDGPMDLEKGERALIHLVRSLPAPRRAFYLDLWADTARRELREVGGHHRVGSVGTD